MTELIDEFQSNYPKGRNKALTLLILTSIGSLGKLALIGLMMSVVILDQGTLHMSKDEKFVLAAVAIVCICGLLNFTGSLMMLRQKNAGIWLYVISQLVTVVIITWCTLAVNYQLREEEQLFLLITYVVTIVYVVLYLTNRKYWSAQKIQL